MRQDRSVNIRGVETARPAKQMIVVGAGFAWTRLHLVVQANSNSAASREGAFRIFHCSHLIVTVFKY